MKKIYTFTLMGDNYPSSKYDSDLRLFAYLLYDSIYNYDDDGRIPLDINDGIKYNQINYTAGDGHGYTLSSDLYDDGYTEYEPFIIGDKIVGLTIWDDNFDMDVISKIAQETINLLNLKAHVIIRCFPYYAKDKNDESNRENALCMVFQKLGYEYDRKTKTNFLGRFIHNKRSKKNR